MSESVRLGFGENNDSDVNSKVKSELKRQLKPELINRLDEIVIFKPLEKGDLNAITVKMLNELKERAEKIGIKLNFDSNVPDELINESEVKKYGARYIKRSVSEKIENLISQQLLEGHINKGEEIEVIYDEGEFKLASPLVYNTNPSWLNWYKITKLLRILYEIANGEFNISYKSHKYNKRFRKRT